MIIYYPTVAESIKDKDKPPISWKEWKEAFDEIKDEAKEAAHNAQAAASHYPLIKNGIWYVWNAKSGEYISTGVEAEGTTGEPGRNGTDGQDGVSPAITVTDIPGGHRITITDAEHPNGQTVDVMDGENGSDGLPGTPGSNGVDGTTFTPSVAANGDLSWSNDGGKTNPETVNIKGPQGPPGSTPGAATSAQVKAGTASDAMIAPSIQDASSFFGLAKASGDTTQSASSNEVGVYTDAAKIAIQKMLGINETFDLLETINLTDTGSDIVTIRNSDMQGIAYAYDAFVVDVETSQLATIICGIFAGASDARTKLVSYNRASKKRFRLYVFGLGSGLWWAIGMDDSGSSGTITPSSSYSPITNATDKISYISAELRTGFESATIKLFGMKK